jgi:hypothetical protein
LTWSCSIFAFHTGAASIWSGRFAKSPASRHRSSSFSGTIASAQEVRELAALGVAGYVNEYTAVQHIVPSLIPHLAADQQNRRSSPRAVAAVAVSYRFGNTIAAALTLNVSRGGLAIRTTSALDVGTGLKVRFRLPGGRKRSTSRPKWRGSPADGHGTGVHAN